MTDAAENGLPGVSPRLGDFELVAPVTPAGYQADRAGGDGNDAAAAGVPSSGQRRRVWNVLLVVLCVLLLVPAAALLVVSRGMSTDAQRARTAAAAADHEREQVATRAHRADQQQGDLTVAVDAIGPAMANLSSSLNDAVDAQNHLADVDNQAVSLFNNGELSASEALFRGSGAQATVAMDQKVALVHRALVQAQAAAQHLQEALHG